MDNNPDKKKSTQQTVEKAEVNPKTNFLFFGEIANENKMSLLATFSEMQRTYLSNIAKDGTSSDEQIDKICYHLFLIEKLLFHA